LTLLYFSNWSSQRRSKVKKCNFRLTTVVQYGTDQLSHGSLCPRAGPSWRPFYRADFKGLSRIDALYTVHFRENEDLIGLGYDKNPCYYFNMIKMPLKKGVSNGHHGGGVIIECQIWGGAWGCGILWLRRKMKKRINILIN